MSIEILLAEDHKLMREGLRALLEKQRDMKIVAEAEDGRTAVRLARKLSPKVAIVDIALPNLNGMETTRQIVAANPAIKVIALSMYADRRFVVGMLDAGASGYVIKDSAFNELVRAIRTVLTHRLYLCPDIVGVTIEEYKQRLSKSAASSVLTTREREVLQLLAEGKTTKQIAAGLHVSVKTVETHRQQIMYKLGLKSVAQLTKYAIREGLTSLES